MKFIHEQPLTPARIGTLTDRALEAQMAIRIGWGALHMTNGRLMGAGPDMLEEVRQNGEVYRMSRVPEWSTDPDALSVLEGVTGRRPADQNNLTTRRRAELLLEHLAGCNDLDQVLRP